MLYEAEKFTKEDMLEKILRFSTDKLLHGSLSEGVMKLYFPEGCIVFNLKIPCIKKLTPAEMSVMDIPNTSSFTNTCLSVMQELKR